MRRFRHECTFTPNESAQLCWKSIYIDNSFTLLLWRTLTIMGRTRLCQNAQA